MDETPSIIRSIRVMKELLLQEKVSSEFVHEPLLPFKATLKENNLEICTEKQLKYLHREKEGGKLGEENLL